MTIGSRMCAARLLSRISLTRLPSAASISFGASTGCRDFRSQLSSQQELERIETLHDPERAVALGALNDSDPWKPYEAAVQSGAADTVRR